MKKIFITFFTLSCFVFVGVLPLFLGLHASVMSHHGMSAGDCIEHCISTENQLYSSKIIGSLQIIEIGGAKILFSRIFEFLIPLVLLYALLIHAPPNLYHNIKNYNYGSLIGIIKSTT